MLDTAVCRALSDGLGSQMGTLDTFERGLDIVSGAGVKSTGGDERGVACWKPGSSAQGELRAPFSMAAQDPKSCGCFIDQVCLSLDELDDRFLLRV